MGKSTVGGGFSRVDEDEAVQYNLQIATYQSRAIRGVQAVYTRSRVTYSAQSRPLLGS
jgi:hypothetical protein